MTEIDALKTIDDALSGLADDAVRDRVLRWACQKYLVPSTITPIGTDEKAAPLSPQVNAAATKQKAKSRSKPSPNTSPSIVRDLNLKPKGKDSFDQFVARKNPSSNQQKCVVAIYYLRHDLDLSPITVDHVYTCFKQMQWRVPSSLANTLAYVSSVHGWLDTRNMGDIKLTTLGENLVEHDLPSSKKGAGA